MRVALSLLTFDPRIAGGAETYVRELCAAFDRVGTNDYAALVTREGAEAAGPLPATVATGLPIERGPGRRARSIIGPALRPGAAGRFLDEADVVHYPVTVPVPGTNRPRVVTLHDLQHRDLPDLFSRTTRAFRRGAYDRAARRADHVIVVSEWVREHALDLLGLDPARVHAIPHGVDVERFRPIGRAREPFLLYPARGWPHKNHARLFEAFADLRAENAELRLVLTSDVGSLGRDVEGVETLGRVDPAMLADLYGRAAALVFPSVYEGFGLPVLEALASGCPVACSNVGALAELAGGAAVLFDPTDPAAIAAGVREALQRAGELSAAGPVRASHFTWDATARAHDEVYALAVAG